MGIIELNECKYYNRNKIKIKQDFLGRKWMILRKFFAPYSMLIYIFIYIFFKSKSIINNDCFFKKKNKLEIDVHNLTFR